MRVTLPASIFVPTSGERACLRPGPRVSPFPWVESTRATRTAATCFRRSLGQCARLRPRLSSSKTSRGLLRQTFRPYFDYIKRQLHAPELCCPKGTDWREHDARLERKIRAGATGDLRYNVEHQLLNAADLGVPQTRERVFIVAIRSDLGVRWTGLAPTHSADALLYAKWVDGSYWREHHRRSPDAPKQFASRIARLEAKGAPPLEVRWRTVRDALNGLPEPHDMRVDSRFLNHVGNPGARSYPGHTGSPYDEPAKTLKAGDHGVPGGENMLRREDGSLRYFTVREAARLQGFPDEYEFAGAWSQGFRQLGNAVPVPLAESVVRHAVQIVERGCLTRSARAGERVA